MQVIRPAGGVLKVDAFFGDGQQGCLISRVDGNLAEGELWLLLRVFVEKRRLHVNICHMDIIM